MRIPPSRLLLTCVAIISGLLMSPAVFPGTFTFQPKTTAAGGFHNFHDAFIADDGSWAGSGSERGLISRCFGNYNRHYLVQFDELGLWIGGPEEIVSATLTLQYYGPASNIDGAGTSSINVHCVTEPWSNGATWTSRGPSLGGWSGGNGGTYDPTVEASVPFASLPAVYAYANWDVTDLVADWVSGAAPHFGFMLKWSGQTDFKREWFFGGPGQGGGTVAPKLTIVTARTSSIPFTVSGTTVNVKTLGAQGNGVHNDTAAFRAAAIALQAAGGGTLVIPPGVYIVGEQQHIQGQYPYYQHKQIFTVSGLSNLLVEGNGATIRVAGGLRYGSFDKNTGAAYYPSMPFTDSEYRAAVGNVFDISSSENVLIRNLRIDGNNTGLILGGEWAGATGGRQLVGSGIVLLSCRNVYLENIDTHHNACDGLMIGWPGLTDNGYYTLHRLTNVRSEYNGRQGLSWIGGNGLEAYNCKFNHTGRAALVSSPGAGLDIEAESSICRNGYFVNCEFINNAGAGIVADTGDGGYSYFWGCTIWGTDNYSAWVAKPGVRFDNCGIFGTAVHGYPSSNSSLATMYNACLFEDREYGSAGVFRGGALAVCDKGSGSATNITYKNCTFVANETKSLYLSGSGMKVENCIITHRWANAPDHDFQAYIQYGVQLKDTYFYEEFASGSTQYYLAVANAVVGTNVWVEGPRCKWQNWSWGATGTIPPSP